MIAKFSDKNILELQKNSFELSKININFIRYLSNKNIFSLLYSFHFLLYKSHPFKDIKNKTRS